MANLTLKHIYKVYPNGTKAVNDFSMDIEDKEFIVFVGPSGCGKSTTLRMIAGLENITAGELKIGDAVVNEMEPKDRDIAMVFQNYALYPHMTIYENIAFALRVRKVPKDEIDRRVTEAAKILGITEYLNRKPKEMSGGQRQRVALGRAIVREPKVMLLDEPLSNLDAKLRTHMRTEIVKLHKKLQTTFIYVTHDQVEAMTMGTRIVVMKDGFIQQIDTPKNLYSYPVNKFVAGFIGTPQMNFFEGTLKKDGDKVEIAIKDSPVTITVPYCLLMKTLPQYFDGITPVIIGLRSEDISLDVDNATENSATIRFKVSHSEELGTETLVYGDLNSENDDFSESKTRIIIKATGFRDMIPDEICEAAINIEKMHLFDAETEENILPRIPKHNCLDCEVKDKKLTFLGNTLELPDAIDCTEGTGELLIPVSAISFNGKISANIVGCEEIKGQYLISIDMNGARMYALSPCMIAETSANIGIDFKKVIIKIGETVIEPMPEVNGLEGSFVMEKSVQITKVKGKDKKEKVPHFYLSIADTKIEAPQEVCEKMFAATSGRRVYNLQYRYEWSPYDFKISDDGITAEAVELLNYGSEAFLKCVVGKDVIYVYAQNHTLGAVKLMPDVGKVSVVEIERQIRIV